MIPEIKDSLKLLQWGIAEAVWPTRCVICDTPGALLCRACELSLPYLDQLLACPACGAPWGRSICCECNQQTLRWKGLERFPLEGCASATLLSPETKRIVTTFKDRGERELSETIARLMAQALPPSWRGDTAFVPIPARKNAVRERGFDHVALIAGRLSELTGIPRLALLRALPRRDQRDLDARQRLSNMAGSFALAKSTNVARGRASKALHAVPPRIILVDDVLTTGATLFTAANILRASGAKDVRALTFIRA